jgi:hypothetical protein
MPAKLSNLFRIVRMSNLESDENGTCDLNVKNGAHSSAIERKSEWCLP